VASFGFEARGVDCETDKLERGGEEAFMALSDPAKIRNISVVGHRGSGKTSLIEAMLFTTGVKNRLGLSWTARRRWTTTRTRSSGR